jgi:hypothetical protein
LLFYDSHNWYIDKFGLAEGGDSIGQRILNVVKLNVSL